MATAEVFIETIDVADLTEGGWPFLKVFARHFVEEMELGRYVKQLLLTRRWTAVRMVPHQEKGVQSDHVFDIFGVPAQRQDEQGFARGPLP